MRTTLLALLLALPACKSDEAPKVSASAATAVAGTVVDVTGTVTVAGKPLAKGDTVTADTTIDTGADSSATILLAHNDVKLELGANKHVRVNESVAWKAPKRVEPTQGAEAATMSAGRPAERNAAETSVTAIESAPQAAVAAPGAPPAGGAKSAGDGAAPPPPPPKAKQKKQVEGEMKTDDSFGQGGLGLTGVGEGGGGRGEGVGLGGIGTIGRGGGGGQGAGYGAGKGGLGGKSAKTPNVKIGTADVEGTLPKDVIQRIVRRHMNQIRYCYEKGLVKNPTLSGKLSVKFVIGPEGSVSTAANDGSTIGDTSVVDCAVGVFKRMAFPKPEGGSVVTVRYPIVFAPSE